MRRLEALDKGGQGRTFGFEAFPGYANLLIDVSTF